MSDGTAKWTDLVELVELAQKRVREMSGVELEPEVRIIKMENTKDKRQSTK